jgi:hypothetical protein
MYVEDPRGWHGDSCPLSCLPRVQTDPSQQITRLTCLTPKPYWTNCRRIDNGLRRGA